MRGVVVLAFVVFLAGPVQGQGLGGLGVEAAPPKVVVQQAEEAQGVLDRVRLPAPVEDVRVAGEAALRHVEAQLDPLGLLDRLCGTVGPAGSVARCPTVQAAACPAPPQFLDADWTQLGVYLDWAASASGQAGYVVYRAVELGEGWVTASTRPLDQVAPGSTSYLDETAEPGVAYVYWVTAVANGCESAPSPPASPDERAPDLADCAYAEANAGELPVVRSVMLAGDCLVPTLYPCTPFRSYWVPSDPSEANVEQRLTECTPAALPLP